MDKVATQTEVLRLYGVKRINEAGRWNERVCSYPRRSYSVADNGESPE